MRDHRLGLAGRRFSGVCLAYCADPGACGTTAPSASRSGLPRRLYGFCPRAGGLGKLRLSDWGRNRLPAAAAGAAAAVVLSFLVPQAG